MGCSCCRMIKSYIYDPSVPVDVPGQKSESCTGSPHQRKLVEADSNHKLHGFHNLGFSTKNSEVLERDLGKLEIDNNELNRLQANTAPPAPDRGGEQNVYILERENDPQSHMVPNRTKYSESPLSDRSPSLGRSEEEGSQGDVWTGLASGDWLEGLEPMGRAEESYASTASLSTTDTRVSHLEAEDGTVPAEPHPQGGAPHADAEDHGSIMDSDVAEALAALEAAMAGEDYD